MKIGLIDIDRHNFPNLALMKLSAYHKAQGDTVQWYDMFGGHFDRVYVAKVFSFSEDYRYPIDADEVFYGGTGYQIRLIDGKETWCEPHKRNFMHELPQEVEHMYPDYAIYHITDTAYGYLTRGCQEVAPSVMWQPRKAGRAYKSPTCRSSGTDKRTSAFATRTCSPARNGSRSFSNSSTAVRSSTSTKGLTSA